jgi:aminoglycoside 6-adenylyltransferase
MRNETEMMELILAVAKNDERIRAVIMNGSRANPNARRDIFQDYDIVYLVTDVGNFRQDPSWIDVFGEIMIMQLPEEMTDPPPANTGIFVYLMQFTDGNRIDLCLYPISQLADLARDSLSILLLDKDQRIEPFPAPNEKDYLPQPPTENTFTDSCNEFWWVSTYVSKGLWRREITYAIAMKEQYVRAELNRMIGWFIGIQTNFQVNPGKFGKSFQQYLEPEDWEMLLSTYAAADYDQHWEALAHMCSLFRKISQNVANHYDFPYPYDWDKKVTAHNAHVRQLPTDASEMYSSNCHR